MMVSPALDAEPSSRKRAPAAVEAETRKQVALKAAEQQRNAAAASPDAATQDDSPMRSARPMLADASTVPPIPRLIADDITPEAAGFTARRAGRTARDHLRRGRHLRHHRRPLLATSRTWTCGSKATPVTR